MAWQKKYVSEEEKSSDLKKAESRAVWYLSQRAHSAEELFKKLCRFFTEEPSAAAVAKMIELEYLDDEKYAKAKANSLLRAHKSRREISRKLSEKGIDRNLIAQILDEIYSEEHPLSGYSECFAIDSFSQNAYNNKIEREAENTLDTEATSAAFLLQRKYMRKLEQGREDLVIAALARRGFSYKTIKQALASLA